MPIEIILALGSIALALAVWPFIRGKVWPFCSEDTPESFVSRTEKKKSEQKKRSEAAKSYWKSIDDAFVRAEQDGKLLISYVDWDAIYLDSNLSYQGKRRMARFFPVMTRELAESILEYEIQVLVSVKDLSTSPILSEARKIRWQVVELPRKYEPKDIKDEHRVSYPNLDSSIWTLALPPVLTEAAEKYLNYGDDHVVAQAEQRNSAKA